MNPEDKLLEMLTWMRPYNSTTDTAFCKKYILDPFGDRVSALGPMNNLVITVGADSKTLFSCHTDTTHRTEGMQNVIYDSIMGTAYKNNNECLGADDTVGVWLMLEMIEAEIPGTYIFHRGEERGCIGSHWIAEHKAEWLELFDRAIAFDRKGISSVITKQRGSTCCSSQFAKALASQLGKDWVEDPTGSFTDTASYMYIIPECTNLSVGYYDQHSREELQDIGFALSLRDLVATVNWESLPTVREAEEETPMYYTPFHQQGTVSFSPPNEAKDLATLSLGELEELCYNDPYYIAEKMYNLLQRTPIEIQDEDLEMIFAGIDVEIDGIHNCTADLEARISDLDTRLARLEELDALINP